MLHTRTVPLYEDISLLYVLDQCNPTLPPVCIQLMIKAATTLATASSASVIIKRGGLLLLHCTYFSGVSHHKCVLCQWLRLQPHILQT